MLALLKIPFFTTPAQTAGKNSVMVCYGKFNPKTVRGFDYVIVESKQFDKSDIKVLKSSNKAVYAYLSIAEVNVYSDLYKELKNNFLGKNKNWESYYLDLKSEKTVKAIIEHISKISNKGFDGIFLDNADNFSQFGFQKSQKKEAVELIKTIKKQFPKLSLIQNSGVELLGETSSVIDAVAVESVYTNYSFQDKKYRLRTGLDFDLHFKKVDEIRDKYKKTVLLIEYVDSFEMYEQVADKLIKNGFDYFIGNIELQTVPRYTKTPKR